MVEQLFKDNENAYVEILSDSIKNRIIKRVNQSELAKTLKPYELEHLALTIYMKEKEDLITKFKNI
jgi:hypothetical protein